MMKRHGTQILLSTVIQPYFEGQTSRHWYSKTLPDQTNADIATVNIIDKMSSRVVIFIGMLHGHDMAARIAPGFYQCNEHHHTYGIQIFGRYQG